MAVICTVLALLPEAVHPEPARGNAAAARIGLSHGPLLGAVSDTGVKLWARAESAGQLQFEIRAPGGSWAPASTPSELGPVNDFAVVVTETGLQPSTAYEYRPLIDGLPVDGGGHFKTLPAVGEPGAFRFAIGGDLSSEFKPFSILDRIVDQRPDFNILLGDLIYADQPGEIPASAEAYREKYRANWADSSFRRLTHVVPSFMMWDDHDITNDYDGQAGDRYEAARAALQTYVACLNPAPRRPGALYYTFQVANVDFFVLDTRTYRSPSRMRDDVAKTMLGRVQKADLESWLLASRAPFKIVLSSVPMHDLGGIRPDDWTSYAAERTELLEFIRERGITGVVVLSGDQHWSSLVRHAPYRVWEFNATPLAHQVRPARGRQRADLVLAYDASPAFGLVDVDTRGPVPSMTFSIVDDAGVVKAARTIGVSATRQIDTH